jgi:predicted TIM-barrel fold metal-dependent hydrolase
MAYIENRVVHDADAHVMETSGWLDDFTDAATREQIRSLIDLEFAGRREEEISHANSLHADTEYRARDNEEIMLRKNYRATGSFLRDDRPKALDLMGVASQLVFPTALNVMLEALEHGEDVDLLYAVASATNRSQVSFCDADKRLLPVGYVPLADLTRAATAADEAIEMGCAALLVPWACPRQHATSHVGLDGVWARAAEAGLPVLFHVGVADRVLPPQHKINGLPPVADFHGGDENFRSISYMAIPSGPQQALSLLILDGVLDRFPTLKIGVIELGAVWVPGFMRQLDSAFEAFARHEERLQSLALRPSEYLTRQVRVTPYPTEPTGWIIEQAGKEICMFSSDYPHVEGGRNPFGRFERAMTRTPADHQEAFFRTNFEDMMGDALARAL